MKIDNDLPTTELACRPQMSEIRQIVVRFGASGYIVRYAALHENGNILTHTIYAHWW